MRRKISRLFTAVVACAGMAGVLSGCNPQTSAEETKAKYQQGAKDPAEAQDNR